MGGRRWRFNSITFFLLFSAHLIKVLSCGDAVTVARLAKQMAGLYGGPYFDGTTAVNVTAQVGQFAYLACKVFQLSNRSVSWIRCRDGHILTVDRLTFIADDRFQAYMVEASNTWTLQVKYVQPRDAGMYECQVSNAPTMSHFVHLSVIVPKVEIIGGSDIYVKAGSTVQLKCVVTQTMDMPTFMFWYRDTQRIVTEKNTKVGFALEHPTPEITTGTLTIYHPQREDSGNYTCQPSNLESTSVILHVLSGENRYPNSSIPNNIQHHTVKVKDGTDNNSTMDHTVKVKNESDVNYIVNRV